MLRCEPLEGRQLLAILLTIPGIDGNPDDPKNAEITLREFSWEFSRTDLNLPPEVSNISFRKEFDAASPALIAQSLIGPVYDKPTALRVTKSKGQDLGDFDLLNLKLTNARLTSFAAFDATTEAGSLNFSKLEYASQFQDPTTKAITKGENAAWNLLDGQASPSSISSPSRPISDQTTLTLGDHEVEIGAFGWNASLPVDSTLTVGRPLGGAFNITRDLDEATPGILGTAALGTVFPTAKITERVQGKVGEVYATWTLSDVFISNFNISGQDIAGSVPKTSFDLSYSKIEVSYTPIDINGNKSPTLTTTWDEALDKSTGAQIFGQSPIPTPALGQITFAGIGQLEYESINWNVNNSVELGNGGEGIFNAAHIKTPVSAATPALIGFLSSGHSIPAVEVNQPSTGGTNDYWKFSNALVTSYAVLTVAGKEPQVTFDLAFAKAETKHSLLAGLDGTTLFTNGANFDQLTQSSTLPPDFGEQLFDNTNAPDLEFVIEDEGQVSEIAINSATWGVGNFDSPFAFLFEVTAHGGLHSSGIFAATTRGDVIDKVTIRSNTAVGQSREEVYRWDLENVNFNGYSTNLLGTQPDEEEYTFSPRKISLRTNEFDLMGNPTGAFSSATWDILQGSVSSTNLSTFGDLQGNTSKTRVVEFPDGSAVEYDHFAFGGSLPVSEPNSSGIRSVGDSRAGEFVFTTSGAPSPKVLVSLASSAEVQGRVNVNMPFNGPGVVDPEVTWSFEQGARFVTFRYADSINQIKPDNQFVLRYDKVEHRHTPLDSNGSLSDPISVTWDDAGNTSDLTGGFGTQKFPDDKVPAAVLNIGSGASLAQLTVLNYSWGTSNPVQQLVGTTAHPEPLAARRTATQQIFVLETDLNQATPGLINALAEGVVIPELKIIQRKNIREAKNAYLPYREWILNDVLVSAIDASSDRSSPEGNVFLDLRAGKFSSKFFVYKAKTNSASIASGESPSLPDLEITEIVSSVDFLTPPVALGIGTVAISSVNPRVISLPSFFTDEQELSTNLKYSFEILDNSGLFESASLNTANELVLDYQSGATGSATIRVDVEDAFGRITSDTFQVQLNTPPSFNLIAAPNQTVNADTGVNTVAGLAINISAGGNDTGQTLSFGLTNDNNSLFTVQPAINANGQLTYTLAPDQAGTANVNVTLSDGADTTTVQSFTITVNRVAPTITLIGSATSVPGLPQTYTFNVTSPVNPSARYLFTVRWGDNFAPETITGTTGTTLTHIYNTVGTWSLSVWAKDIHNLTSAPAKKQVSVVTTAIINRVLYVGGTNARDIIALTPVTAANGKTVRVTNGSQDLGTFTAPTQAVVFGLRGNDTISIVAGKTATNKPIRPNLPVQLFGGSGNDVLSAAANAASSVLVGGGGNDLLTGSVGRDLLLGGTEADTLNAGGGDDILVAGSFIYEMDLAALDQLLAIWAGSGTYAERRDRLFFATTPGPKLSRATTFDDGFVDSLLGDGDTDWFIATTTGTTTKRDQVVRSSSETLVQQRSR